jgi:hypothetical protein
MGYTTRQDDENMADKAAVGLGHMSITTERRIAPEALLANDQNPDNTCYY